MERTQFVLFIFSWLSIACAEHRGAAVSTHMVLFIIFCHGPGARQPYDAYKRQGSKLTQKPDCFFFVNMLLKQVPKWQSNFSLPLLRRVAKAGS